MELYRYLPLDSAIKTITSRCFRVSRLKELNDPFEWRLGFKKVPSHMLDIVEGRIESYLDDLNAEMGLISFSAEVRDPILWSHYADRHKGVAFQVKNLEVLAWHEVLYSNNRILLPFRPMEDKDILALIRNHYRQKSKSWRYEREHRLVVSLAACSLREGHYLWNIPEDFLIRVIIGCRSPAKESDITSLLNQNGFPHVQVVKAKASRTTYEVEC